MSNEFEMSMMGELTFFLGLQIKQSKDGIFINQAKYTKELLKRFDMKASNAFDTPMSSSLKLDKDEKGKDVDIKRYRAEAEQQNENDEAYHQDFLHADNINGIQHDHVMEEEDMEIDPLSDTDSDTHSTLYDEIDISPSSENDNFSAENPPENDTEIPDAPYATTSPYSGSTVAPHAPSLRKIFLGKLNPHGFSHHWFASGTWNTISAAPP
ncbi:hypothetical protein RJ640_001859 [Escallonia rubra]|uniref:Reverse transcriptase Ty1/copia-type domain-containing protein n=1 Tax=Escallonia rubra TaxID=112253 RepID=A0AA88RAZ3_9ASTE|nr:hypothetical protein RJ640_001859 [Escallonia rubra]